MNKRFIAISICLFLLHFGLSAQSNSKDSKPDYSNWVVDLSQSRVSFAGIRLEKVTLNDDYTIVQMSFFNRSWYPSWIEACNTFHIRANGKRVASFVRAEGIPTRDVRRHSFTCADERTAMKVYSGQLVRFRIYFTRIPTFLNKIDIIEYDGMQNCEFDVFNLNISEKKPLLSKNSISNKTINSKKSLSSNKKKRGKQVDREKNYTEDSYSPEITSKSLENQVEKEDESKKFKIPPPETRKVIVKKELNINRRILEIIVWDNDIEDGDMVSIMLNNKWIIKGFKVTKNKKTIEIPLITGNNKLVFHADNLGDAPPNTAALSINDGIENQTIILSSDYYTSEAINIVRK